MRACLIVAMLAYLPAPAAAQADSERAAIVAVVQRFFDTMAARDAAQAATVLMSEERFFSMRQETGQPVVRSTTIQQYLKGLAEGKEKQLERMWNAEVKVHGGIAVLWTPYDFYRDGKFSHCGIDAFDLVKTTEGWRIAGAMFTVERTTCPASPLGPPK